MISANERQVGGDHYKGSECPHCGLSLEHWDLIEVFNLDPYQYNITKYVLRWMNKEGIRDLEKALHHLEKYIEVIKRREARHQGLKAGDLVDINRRYEQGPITMSTPDQGEDNNGNTI